MKFLYIAAEHVSGTLALLQAEHRRRGDECRYVTFFPSRWNFPDDICLNLRWMPNRSWVVSLRKSVSPDYSADDSLLPHPPFWRPSVLARKMFQLRDVLNWPRISRALQEHDLQNADIITLDGGLDFTRDCRFARGCKNRGSHIAAFYHGTDLRNRGIIPVADELIELRLTSEWDLIKLDPRLSYLYLPIDTAHFSSRDYKFNRPIRIAHAARNPYKGTASLERAVENLQKKFELELVLFRYHSHDEVLRSMQQCDIVVDQLSNAGGWGYGMAAVEALSMGKPVVTNIPPQMESNISPHPFIQADESTIEVVLENLMSDKSLAREHAVAGLSWVKARHDIRAVADQLYGYYKNLGWLKSSRD